MRSYTETKLLWMTRLADAFTPICFACLALIIHDPFEPFYEDGRFYVLVVAATILTKDVFHYLDFYSIAALRGLRRQVRRLIFGWTVSMVALSIGVLAVRTDLPSFQLWAGAWYVGALFGFVVSHAIVSKVLHFWDENGRLVRNVAVVGASAQAQRAVEYLHRPGSNCRVVAIFGDGDAPCDPGEIAGVPVRGKIDDLLTYSVNRPLDHIVIALPWTAERQIADITTRLSTIPVDIGLVPGLEGFTLGRCHFGAVGGLPVLNIFEKPLSDSKLILKRLEDVTIAAFLLVLLSPLMLVTALLIKLGSPGPVLFRQTRLGLNNRFISVWKFRTMYVDDCTDAIVSQTLRNDPRVTFLGYWLRRTSIDELPQLFNVLQGKMSVVGPRPHAVGTRAGSILFEEAVAEYAARHRVKPGLTGWAQVNGWRGETDTLEKIERRIACDLYYIENWSLLFDLKIILMTAVIVLRCRNAW